MSRFPIKSLTMMSCRLRSSQLHKILAAISEHLEAIHLDIQISGPKKEFEVLEFKKLAALRLDYEYNVRINDLLMPFIQMTNPTHLRRDHLQATGSCLGERHAISFS
jgi:hypothetical protein